MKRKNIVHTLYCLNRPSTFNAIQQKGYFWSWHLSHRKTGRNPYGSKAFLWLAIFGQFCLFSYDWHILCDFIWHLLILKREPPSCFLYDFLSHILFKCKQIWNIYVLMINFWTFIKKLSNYCLIIQSRYQFHTFPTKFIFTAS